MSVVIAAPRHTRRVLTATAALVTLLFLGMSLAAIGQLTGRCYTENDCLAVSAGNCLLVSPGNRLLTGTQTTRCELTGWGLRVDLSERAADILRSLGLQFKYA
jgi:hypothetical protein